MIDLARVHSWCRLCIRIADLNRWKYEWDELFIENNPFYQENIKARSEATQDSLYLKIRERGKYWFKAIYLSKLDYGTLLNHINHRFSNYIELFSIYKVRKDIKDKKEYITTDDHIQNLHPGDEIEIILLDIIESSPATKWDDLRKAQIEKEKEKKKAGKLSVY